jgi:hypothetical protein
MRYWLIGEVDARVWSALHALVMTPGRLERAAMAAQDAARDDGATWERDLASAERRLAALTRTEAAILARFRRGAIGRRRWTSSRSGSSRARHGRAAG